jgi:hypothetical protein
MLTGYLMAGCPACLPAFHLVIYLHARHLPTDWLPTCLLTAYLHAYRLSTCWPPTWLLSAFLLTDQFSACCPSTCLLMSYLPVGRLPTCRPSICLLAPHLHSYRSSACWLPAGLLPAYQLLTYLIAGRLPEFWRRLPVCWTPSDKECTVLLTIWRWSSGSLFIFTCSPHHGT